MTGERKVETYATRFRPGKAVFRVTFTVEDAKGKPFIRSARQLEPMPESFSGLLNIGETFARGDKEEHPALMRGKRNPLPGKKESGEGRKRALPRKTRQNRNGSKGASDHD